MSRGKRTSFLVCVLWIDVSCTVSLENKMLPIFTNYTGNNWPIALFWIKIHLNIFLFHEFMYKSIMNGAFRYEERCSSNIKQPASLQYLLWFEKWLFTAIIVYQLECTKKLFVFCIINIFIDQPILVYLLDKIKKTPLSSILAEANY